ncbi:hypothetical protein TEA_026844 [Camellia sinensis var. sinensis]|uniref:Leucine-rich repeat-containing N-terminal plant-type domain-containing protein n=1 Tax=Camellia sinensis var. sinensis TaxID=542762 RepID=A0A4V3WNJ0_CAMSN|nr:hypothetical protein TEA_026844 [Camellia sinensis var. sinensis]
MGLLEKQLCLVSLVLFVTLFSSTINVTSASIKEANALITWKATLQSTNHSLLTSWVLPPHDNISTSAAPCSWFGVTCNVDGSVNRLNLTNSSLNVVLDPFLLLYFREFEKLARLYLYENDLSGPIPPEMRNLVNLVKLYMDTNNFTSPIPSTLGKLNKLTVLHFSLTLLHLGNNKLSGSIPKELGNLKFLNDTELSENQLSGLIPTSLGNLSKLEILFLRSNQLSGPIPREFGNLTNLLVLEMDDNQFSGNLPKLCQGGKLVNFTVNHNQLIEIWGRFPNLTLLNLARNNIIGSIPPGLGNSIQLHRLDPSSNRLVGEIPKEFGKLTSLEKLLLFDNQLSCSIPQELESLTGLSDLDLSTNRFNGSISGILENYLNLFHLNLSNNMFSQKIPFQMGTSGLGKLAETMNWLGSKMGMVCMKLMLDEAVGAHRSYGGAELRGENEGYFATPEALDWGPRPVLRRAESTATAI